MSRAWSDPIGWGLALAAGAHALALAWVWGPTTPWPAPGPARVMEARWLTPVGGASVAPEAVTDATPAIAQAHAARVRAPDRDPAAAVPSAPRATAPERPAPADPPPPGPAPDPAAEVPASLADAATAAPALAGGATVSASAAAAAAAAPPAGASPSPAPGRVPAGHAGCADVPHPPALRERGIEGIVRLRVQVDRDGRARQVQIAASSGWRLFDDAALAQVRSCRFRPAREGETAVETWVEFPVRFALRPA